MKREDANMDYTNDIKKYLVTWYNNGWHNGIWEGKLAYDVFCQLRDEGIRPKNMQRIE